MADGVEYLTIQLVRLFLLGGDLSAVGGGFATKASDLVVRGVDAFAKAGVHVPPDRNSNPPYAQAYPFSHRASL